MEQTDMQINEDSSEYEYEKEEPILITLENTSFNVFFSKLMTIKYFRKNYTFNDIKSQLSEYINKIISEKQLKEDIFAVFFNILQKNFKGQMLTLDEYNDFLKLCSIFHVSKVPSIRKFVKEYSKINIQNIDYIINTILSNTDDNINKKNFGNDYLTLLETNLSQNINQCLKNDNFGKLNISIIYRIIKNSEKNEEFTDILYEFINKSIEKRHLLFEFIDIEKLTKHNFDHLFDEINSTKNEHYYYYLSNSNIKYLIKIRNDNFDLNKSINQLKTKIETQIVYNQFSYQIIKNLMKNVNDVNEAIVDNKNILHLACESGNIELVQYALSLDSIDVNCKSQDDEKTPLFYAVEKENLEIVELLLKVDNIDVNIMSKKVINNDQIIYIKRKTPLFLATKLSNVKIVELLLSCSNIDVNLGIYNNGYINENFFYKKNKKKPPIFKAIQNNNIEIVQLLLKNKNIDVNIPYRFFFGYNGFKLELKEKNEWYYCPMQINEAKKNLTIDFIKILYEDEKMIFTFCPKIILTFY